MYIYMYIFVHLKLYIMYFTKSKHRRLQLAERNAKDEEDVFSKVYFPRTHLRYIFRLVHAPTEFAARANQKG